MIRNVLNVSQNGYTGEATNSELIQEAALNLVLKDIRPVVGHVTSHLVVDVITAHSDRIHDKLPALISSRSTAWNVVRIMFRSKVVSQLVGCHQVSFLLMMTSQFTLLRLAPPHD